MAVAIRPLNSCSNFSPAPSQQPYASSCSHTRQFTSSAQCWRRSNSAIRCSIVGCSIQIIEEIVRTEGAAALGGRTRTRTRTRIPATSKLGLASNGEKRALEQGLLLEFKKDPENTLLAVGSKDNGRKKWTVLDQNGVSTSIGPQQITFIVPGIEDFDHTEITDFIDKAHANLDPVFLEVAWAELLEKNKSVTAEELAEMIFGSAKPLESYCAHLLLSRDEIYFTMLESDSPSSLFRPQPIIEVEKLRHRKIAKEAADKEYKEFIRLLKSAKAMTPLTKPPKLSWKVDEKVWQKIKALEAYAIDACINDNQKEMAEMILMAMGKAKAVSSAVNLLIDIGYFPLHVNLDLLKSNIHTDYPDEILSAAEALLLDSSDPDEVRRIDLTHLKVYAIDVDEADELDDALSARKLQDGRIEVWIHVADPTTLVKPGSKIYREALRRGTSVFLPTATYPMFPQKLAIEGMSLKQGKLCHSVSVSVVLHSDGSIAEYTVHNSIIRPTYMLTYETASELLHMNLEEESELKILDEAAALRLRWRQQQGAIVAPTIQARIKVDNPNDPDPSINLYVENQADPTMRLVSEMMILCGEAIADFGCCNKISLPYRGQPQSDINASEFSHLPQGPVRSSALVKIMRGAEMDFRKPIRHGLLGIPGYVQFTSPVRRFMDLVAHYQVKAFLRGDEPPFSAGELEGMNSIISTHVRAARNLFNSSLRYWMLEYLRRQPKGKKFRALILKFIKDRIAALLLVEIGLQTTAWVRVGSRVGDEVVMQVKDSHPRRDFLSLKEVAP